MKMWIPAPVPQIVPPHCYYNPSRPSWLLGGTLDNVLGVDPRECGYTTQPQLCVSTPTYKAEMYLLRDVTVYKSALTGR